MDKPSLVEVAGHFTQLQELGGGLCGRCPFCDDRLPLFRINPDRGLWHCLGCQEGGDVDTFLNMIRNS